MRLLILTDIHGNLPALEAVLASPGAQQCDRVYSLGDHTGFGPQPRQVHERLMALDTVMLMGNHEERLLHLDDPSLQSRNWALLHWIGREMQGCSVNLPIETRFGPLLMTHAVPGNVNRLIFPPDVPAYLAALPESATHLITGHNHEAWHIESGGRTGINPGSLGMQEGSSGGLAAFLTADVTGSDVQITRHECSYDVNAVKRAYLQSGCTAAAPIFTRLAWHTIQTGRNFTLRFMRHAKEYAAQQALDMQQNAAWIEIDRTFGWDKPVPSDIYWKELASE